MLLAAQMTFQWHREQKAAGDLREEYDFSNGVKGPVLKDEPEPESTGYEPSPWPFTVKEEKKRIEPVVAEPTVDLAKDFLKEAETRIQEKVEEVKEFPMPIEQWNKMIEEAEKAVTEETKAAELPVDLPIDEESKKKTYMTKDKQGQIQIKNRS